MKRNFDLKRRECRDLPPEKLRDILSKIYPEDIVNELMKKLVGDKGNGKEETNEQ